MNGDKLLNLQMQVRQNSEEAMNYVNDLNSWTEEIKIKEECLKDDKKPVKKFLPPVRSRIKKKKTDNPSAESTHNAQIKSWDYKAWDKFDVDKACQEVDKSEDEEEEEITDEVQDRVNSLREQGNNFFKKGRHNDALSSYTQALLLDPCNSVLLSNRAMAYIKLEKYDIAENDCTKAIEFDNMSVKAYMRRGKARQLLKKYKLAQEDFNEVLKIEPQNKFSQECLSEISKILYSEDPKNKPNVNNCNAIKNKGIVMPITKPISERSKKPLKRIPIEEIGLDLIQIPSADKHKSQEDESFKKFLDSDLKQKTENIKQDEKVKEVDIMKVMTTPTANNKTSGESGSSLLAPPTNSYQFQVDWNMLKNKDSEFFHYLKMIDPVSYKQIFGEAFDSDILSKIISVLHQYYDDADVYAILKSLTDVKRFSMNVKFLSSADNQKLEKIFEKLSKNRPEDVKVLRSLYK